MKRWVSRVLIFLFILLWLFILFIPLYTVVLARNGQIQIGDINNRHWRVFLLQEAQLEGLGLERARTVAVPEGAPETARCLKTTVSYWFWSGTGDNAAYCRCIDTATGAALPLIPVACQVP